jgi:periplasmic divalent cation tolerance protein
VREMFVLVYITTSTREEAEQIGEAIVKERLAACANVYEKISSIYWWKGNLEKDNEAVLLLKTKKDKVNKIMQKVKELHSYENPCIIAIPIIDGSKEYLDWIDREVKGG